MGRPCHCCGEWYTTEKLTYDAGIKRSANVDFFYDHNSVITGSGDYSPSYGWLETYDIFEDYEGVSVFARGTELDNSLDFPFDQPSYARARRCYTDKLKNIPLNDNINNIQFDKEFAGNNKDLPLRFLPVTNDKFYKKYRNPNYPIAFDDDISSDFLVEISYNNIFRYTSINSGYDWKTLYENLFYQYNPNYTSIPGIFQFEEWFGVDSFGEIELLFWEVSDNYNSEGRIYAIYRFILPTPEAGDEAGDNTGIYVLIELDYYFNIINVTNYYSELIDSSYFTNSTYPTYDIRKLRVKNGKIYILHLGVFGLRYDAINEFQNGTLDYNGPKRCFNFVIMDLNTKVTQSRFTGGVNYDKYHKVEFSSGNNVGGFGSANYGRTFNSGDMYSLTPLIDVPIAEQPDYRVLQDALDNAIVLGLNSNTNNYIEIYTPDIAPSTTEFDIPWNVDSVTGGYIVSVETGQNGNKNPQTNSTDYSYGKDLKTTVNIDFSAGDEAIIVFKALTGFDANGDGAPDDGFIYRAIKYRKDTFFSHLSYPKDFDVDSDGDIYMLMEHDCIILPWENTVPFNERTVPILIQAGTFGYVLDYNSFTRNNWVSFPKFTSYFYDYSNVNRITTDRASTCHIPFDVGNMGSLPADVTNINMIGLMSSGNLKSVINKNNGIRPDGTEYADVVKISGVDGSLIDSTVYFNSYLSTGITFRKHELYDGSDFYYETYSGVPINCIEVTDDGVWVGGGQVWPAFGTLGDYVPPRWVDFYTDDGNSLTYEDGYAKYHTKALDLTSTYTVPVNEVYTDPAPPRENVQQPNPRDTMFINGSTPTYVSPAWNTDAIQIYQGDFKWLVGWMDVSSPRSPDIDEFIYDVPYNTSSLDLPVKDLANFDSIAVGGPPIQQDIVVDGVLTYAIFDAFNGELVVTDIINGVFWRWPDQVYRTSIATGVCYTEETGCFFPASSRDDGTYLIADYPYNLLLFDFDLSLKDKYYFGPSDMDYEKLSSQYIMKQFSQINGMCSVGNDIYITGNRRHDNITHCSGDENANDEV